MFDVIGIEPQDDNPEPCDFCEDEETGLPTGYVCCGMMLCPDCQGTKQVYGRVVTRNLATGQSYRNGQRLDSLDDARDVITNLRIDLTHAEADLKEAYAEIERLKAESNCTQCH